jgi:DUF971 family protein
MADPTEIRFDRAERVLHVTYSDGAAFALPAEYLRVESPSAEVQGHSPDQKVTVGGKRMVTITGIEPVGNYAVRLIFGDKHDSGLFSWTYLRELGEQHDRRWAAYLRELAARGLDRG